MKVFFAFVLAISAAVTQAHGETITELKLRAEQGDAQAQAALSSMFYDGSNVQQSYEEAAKWAARSGFGSAAFEVLEEEGLQVVEEFLPEGEDEQTTAPENPAGKGGLRERLAERSLGTG